MDFTKYIVTLSEEELEDMKDLVDDNSEHIWDAIRPPSAAYPDHQMIPTTHRLAFLLEEISEGALQEIMQCLSPYPEDSEVDSPGIL